jgi:hypothetical protein
MCNDWLQIGLDITSVYGDFWCQVQDWTLMHLK